MKQPVPHSPAKVYDTGRKAVMSIVADQCPKSTEDSRRAKKFITWLRQRTCGLIYGTKSGDRVKPSVLKADMRTRLNTCPRFTSLKNEDYQKHFDGTVTHYFYASHKMSSPDIIFMIDIDVKKASGLGTTEGAWTFAEHLRTKFPKLYCERSTGGQGVHGFGVLCKGDLGARRVRQLLRRLQQWLVEEAIRFGADIELVEVKGLPMLLQYHRGHVAYIHPGEFAKIPREVHRANEIMDTTRFTANQLARLKLDAEPDHSDDDITDEDPVEVITIRRNGEEVEAEIIHDAFGITSLRYRPGSNPDKTDARSEPVPTPTVRKTAPEVPVSLPRARAAMEESKTLTYGSGRLVKAGHVQIVAQHLRKVLTDQKVKGRNVTVEDVAIMLVILRHCSKRMNADGSMPTERIKGLWRAAFQSGTVDRAPNNEVIAYVRDRLSETGRLEVVDMTYLPPRFLDDGSKLPGQACKWRLSQELVNDLDRLIAQQSTDATDQPSFALLTQEGGALVHSVFRPGPRLIDYLKPTLRFTVWNAVIEQGREIEAGLYVYAA